MKLTDAHGCQTNNKGNALILNPLIRICVSRKFTDLHCVNRLAFYLNFCVLSSIDRGQEIGKNYTCSNSQSDRMKSLVTARSRKVLLRWMNIFCT